MNTILIRLLLGVLLLTLFLTQQTLAAVTGVSTLPKQAQVTANKSNILRINWRIATDVGHSSGATSTQAELVDPSGKIVVPIPVAGVLNATGVGPYSISETINLSSIDLTPFRDQGVRRILLRREFSAPLAPGFSANVLVTIVDSQLSAARDGSSELTINRLALDFSDGRIVKLVEPGEALSAELNISYSGTGLLQGRWQISEPGSATGHHAYRTLGLVRKQLNRSQRIALKSPQLFTDVPGKYRLRFCVTNSEFIDRTAPIDDASCPNTQLSVAIAYQVSEVPRNKVAVIGDLTPESGRVDVTTDFGWAPTTGAVLYQLQVFVPASDPDSLPSFLTGMLLPSSDSTVRLSSLVLSKLVSGQRYLWRVTAHDQEGRLLARSEERVFIYHE